MSVIRSLYNVYSLFVFDIIFVLPGTQELFQEATTNGTAPGSTCKIQFLGDARAGKTSLCKKLRGEPFNPHEEPTFGIATKMCQVNEVDDVNWKERRTDGNGESSEFIDVTTWYLANRLSKIKLKDNSAETSAEHNFRDMVFVAGIILAICCSISVFIIVPPQILGFSWSFVFLVNAASALGLLAGNTEMYRVLAGASFIPLMFQLLGKYAMCQDSNDSSEQSIDTVDCVDSIHSSVYIYFPQWLLIGYLLGFLCSCGLRTMIIYTIVCAWVPSEPLQINLLPRNPDVQSWKTSTANDLVIVCCPGMVLGVFIQCTCSSCICAVTAKLSGMELPLRQKDHIAFVIVQVLTFYTVYSSNYWMIVTSALGVSFGISLVYGLTHGRTVFVQIDNCHFCQGFGVIVGCVVAHYCNFDFAFADISSVISLLSSGLSSAVRTWLVLQVQSLKRRTVGKNQAPVKLVSDKLFQVAAKGLQAMKLPKKLSLWDFAGQELYYNTHHAFMSSHAVYLLIFDMTTFNDPVNRFTAYQRIQFWLQSIYCHTEAPVLLVGTHLDQFDTASRQDIRQLFARNLSTFSLMHNCKLIFNGDSPFFEIDNSQTNAASDDTVKLRSALRKISQKTEPMRNEYPIKWRKFLEYIHSIRRKVESNLLPENSLITTVQDLRRNIDDYGTLQELRDMLVYFSEAGEIIYDSVDCVLRQFVVFDPQFLVNFMQTISAPESIDDSAHLSAYCIVLRQQGILHFALAKEILKCDDDAFVEMVLSLLEANDLICKIRGCQGDADQTYLYLVPSMLPKAHLGLPNPEWDQHFFIDFGDFHPRVILSRLMSRCASYSELPWRSGNEHFIHQNGGLFSLGNQFCFQLQVLNPCPSQYLIEVAIRAVPGSNPLDLLRHIWNILETIRYRDFPKLRYSCGILCPHQAPHPGHTDESMFHVIPFASHRQQFTEEDKIVRLCFTRLVEFPQAKVKCITCPDKSIGAMISSLMQ